MARMLVAVALASGLLLAHQADAADSSDTLVGSSARLLTALDVDDILAVAKGFGSATLSKDKDGDPIIKCKSDGIAYSVLFYGCTDGANCKSIQFSTGFALKTKISAAKIAQWNREKRWLAATLDEENDPIGRHDVQMAGGLSEKNLEENFETWIKVLADFTKYIGYKT